MYEWTNDSIEQSYEIFNELSLDWGFKLNEPATEEDLREYELTTGITLPPSYRLFLLKHNGAHLFLSKSGSLSTTYSWWADSGILVFGTAALTEYRNFVYKLSDNSDRRLPLPIAYLGRIGTGDFCGLDMNNSTDFESPVLDCNPDYPSDEWLNSVIANSFEDWLKEMFSRVIGHKSFPEYWFKDTLYDCSLCSRPQEGNQD